MQAPGRDRLFPESHFQHLKSCKTRSRSFDEMDQFLSKFTADSLQSVKMEIICGDFNTDKYSNFDQEHCFSSKLFREMSDATANISYGSTFVIQNNRHSKLSTPSSLKRTIEVSFNIQGATITPHNWPSITPNTPFFGRTKDLYYTQPSEKFTSLTPSYRGRVTKRS